MYYHGTKNLCRLEYQSDNTLKIGNNVNLDIIDGDFITGLSIVTIGENSDIFATSKLGIMFQFSNDLKFIKHKIDFLKIHYQIKTRASVVFKSSTFS